MVNPYIELNRVLTQKRLSADKLLQQSSLVSSSGAPSTVSGGGSRLGAGSHHDAHDDASLHSSRSGAGWRPPHCADPAAAKEAEHNTIPFGKWFFFCQHCRHGGHANCIDQWFGGSGSVSSDPVLCGPVATAGTAGVGAPSVKRVVCGVNGCDCKCVSRL
jgi:hypothetical protein